MLNTVKGHIILDTCRIFLFLAKAPQKSRTKDNNARLNPHLAVKVETKLCVAYFCIFNMWLNTLCNKRYGFSFVIIENADHSQTIKINKMADEK